jgi:hypothetical protein
MSSADELFCNGQIRHIRLAAALLQPPQPHGDAAAAPGSGAAKEDECGSGGGIGAAPDERDRVRAAPCVGRLDGRCSRARRTRCWAVLQPGEADAQEPGHRQRRRGPQRRRALAARARPRGARRDTRGRGSRGPGRCRERGLRGLPRRARARGEGQRAAALRPPLPCRVHRRLVPRRRHVPARLCRADVVVVNAAPSAPAKDGAPP